MNSKATNNEIYNNKFYDYIMGSIVEEQKKNVGEGGKIVLRHVRAFIEETYQEFIRYHEYLRKEK